MVKFGSLMPFCFKLLMNRGEKLNVTSLEEWMSKAKAPALEHSLTLFNEIKAKGIQIILVSSRREHLRSATIDNLVNVGFHGWSGLVLRYLSLSPKFFTGYHPVMYVQKLTAGVALTGDRVGRHKA